MVLLLGHLPRVVDEKDITDLLNKFSVVMRVDFFDDAEKRLTSSPSNYECMVTMETSSPVVANIVANKVNNLFWNGSAISAHMLVF